MESVGKLATPAVAATVLVPESVPPPGLKLMATVMVAAELVTVLPKVSWTTIWIAGLMATPATADEGWTPKASLLAAAGVMLKALLVAPVSEPEAAFNV